ncbi:protein NETWORKED 1D [Salvia divinorum]|uniref:Protein NETWORKED 1D n=1 Tax=Salvia divinorum TaxID=28513 RepID=A0ABD1GSV2_SALDI
MAKMSHSDSRRMYSWWWDSHISPKNSKWLQENLTDMDVKVKSMIKLLEAEEDSFARRAEMYYKKRPELMKMVEEFYRAYRALAERYDHATGVIRHAHRTMTEAQVPMEFTDDSPASSLSGADPRTPDLIGGSTDDSDYGTRKRTSKPLIGSFMPIERVRRGLNFDEAEDRVEGVLSNENSHVDDKSSLKLERQNDSKEIIALKEAIAKLEAEKEASIVQHQQTLDKLSQLETEISRTREDFSMLKDHANKADTEVAVLNRTLATLETEKESKFQDYQNCLDKITELQTTVSATQDDAQKLSERAKSAEVETQSLKSELDILAVEKDAALNQYIESLEIISNMENKLRLAEENSSGFKGRAEKAESEVESLRQAISKLTEEKESTALQYQQCLETISSLEQKLKLANEEAKRLNGEIESGVSKLKGAEEQCLILEKSNQSLHSELKSLMLKMGTQSQELTEKQKELGRLWAAVQEERLRFVDAETAFQTLQHLHAQTQEELRAMASELQNRAQLLKVAETQNHSLQDEVLKVEQENKHLDELNSSSALSIQDMRNEISSLTESTEKLEEEVELRLDQRNALQQEIYCLKEELNDLNMKHLSILDQVHEVGLNPESLGSSVKELQDESSSLKETCQRESTDKAALLLKLEIMEQLFEKNSLLETSLSDLNAELDAVRGKIEELEQSCQSLIQERSSLLDEKETLTTQLQETNKNLEKLTENNTVLEISLSDAHHQLEALKAKSKILEDSCQLLVNEKADLMSENDSLTSQLEQTQRRLVDLEKLHGELEGRRTNLENEKELTLRKVEELQVSLEAEKQEHSNSIEMNKARLTGIQSDMHVLQEEHRRRKTELDHVLDSAIASEIEIFVLCTTAQVMKENYCSLVTKNCKLIEQSILSEKEISRLEDDNLRQQSEIKLMSDHVSTLRSGTRQLLKVLSIAEDCVSADNVELDQVYASQLSSTLQRLKKSLCDADEENLEWSVAFSVLVTWIKELGLHSKNVEVEKDKLEHEFKLKTEQVLQLQSDFSTLLEMNEELKSKLTVEDRNKEALMIQIENLNSKLRGMQVTCQDLQSEKLQSAEERRSLMDSIMHSEEKHNFLEEENYVLCYKVLALENLSLIFQSFAEEKLRVLRDLGDDHNKLSVVNTALIGKLSVAEGRLEESRLENLHLKERLQKTDNELKAVATDKDQLSVEIENGKEILHQMAQELQEAGEKIILAEKKKLELSKSVEDLRMEYNEIKMARDEQESQILKLSTDSDNLSKENNILMDSIRHYEEKHNVLEEENYALCDKVLTFENLSLIFQSFADEKLRVLRDLGDVHNKLNVMNTALIGKLSVAEGKLEESKLENLHLKERLQKTDNELKAVATDKDQLSVEIEIGKEVLHQMAQELQEAGEKIILAEKKKIEFSKSVEDLRMENNEVKIVRDEQENQILKLSTDSGNLSKENNFLREATQKLESGLQVLQDNHDKSKLQEKNLHLDLDKKINEINELEARAVSLFSQLQHSVISQVLYEQKFYELYDACLGYIDQNEGLKNQLDAFRPEIVSLKECISSLEDQTDIHIKFQNPENEDLQEGTGISPDNIQSEDKKVLTPVSDLRDLRVRLEAVVKAAVEIKDLMVQENIVLHSKLDQSLRQIELLQSESGKHRRNRRPTSEITVEDTALLTKDIVLDQVSDGSHRYSRKEAADMDSQIVELWETAEPDGTVGLTIGKSNRTIPPSTTAASDFRRSKSTRKQKGGFAASSDALDEDLSVDKLEISKRSTGSFQEGNKRKVLERLDSDVQKLANLQITVHDLKRKLEVAEKGKRGKAVIECETLKRQLDEADRSVMQLFDLNGRLMKSVDDRSFSDSKSSFDFEGEDGARRRRVSEQARRMSEKIGRIQLEVQKLQFILLKLDEKDGASKMSDRRILLRDYLYGGGRGGQRRKKGHFCACVRPSTLED